LRPVWLDILVCVQSILHELYRKENQSVAISVKAVIKENEPITLTLSDGENSVTATGNIPQKAKSKALSYEEALKNLTKFGDTPYFDEGGSVNLDDGLFVSVSELNALRRTACEMLDNERCKITRKKATVPFIPSLYSDSENKTPDIIIRLEHPYQMPNDLSGIKAVIVPLEKDFERIDGVENIVDIPRGIINEKTIANRLLLFKSKGFEACLCGNLSAVEIAKNLGFNIIADTGLNIHNSHSANAINDLGAKAVILSPELTCDAVKNLASPVPKGIITYGNIPLMLFKNCPIKNGKSCSECDKTDFLTDRLGTQFPVRCRMGYSELLNSVPLWMADKKENLTGLDFQLLFFTSETPERVAHVINAYKNGFSADCKFTRGLFFKGTI